MAAFAFVPDGQAPVAEQPGDRALNLPPVPPEPLAGLDAAAGDPGRDAAPAQPGQGADGVTRLVSVQRARPPAVWHAPRTDGWYTLHQRLQCVAVVDAGRRDTHRQRDALGAGQHAAAPVQLPARPTSSSTAWCSRRTPALAHWPNRRCAVWNGTLNDVGRSRDAHPLVGTYTIAVNTARSSSGAVPTLRKPLNLGISASTSAHNSSGTNRTDN